MKQLAAMFHPRSVLVVSARLTVAHALVKFDCNRQQASNPSPERSTSKEELKCQGSADVVNESPQKPFHSIPAFLIPPEAAAAKWGVPSECPSSDVRRPRARGI